MEDDRNVPFGIVTIVICIIFYGTSFTPMKLYSGGDGIFVQWMMTVGQFLPGGYILWRTNFPPIHPFAMLGGCLYTLANCFTVFIMESLGMTIAPLFWNSTCCIVGWAVARFGIFGLNIEVPNMPMVNLCGVVTVIVGGSLYTLIHLTPFQPRPNKFVWKDDDKKVALESMESEPLHPQSRIRRSLCILLALALGCVYGNLLTPISLLLQSAKKTGLSSSVEDYLFSHFLGGFLSSTFVFVVYTLTKRNRPNINPEIALPAMLSGALFGTGEVLFFLSNHHLSQVIAFPIVSMTPSLINSIWGILLFKEIRGTRNLLILGGAYMITMSGVLMIAISKFKL